MMHSIYHTETARNRMIASLGSLIEAILSKKQENSFSIKVIRSHFSGLNDSTIKTIIKDMIARNYLIQKGTTRYTYYSLTQSVLNRAITASSYTNAAIYYIDQLYLGANQRRQNQQQVTEVSKLRLALNQKNEELQLTLQQLKEKTEELDQLKAALAIIKRLG